MSIPTAHPERPKQWADVAATSVLRRVIGPPHSLQAALVKGIPLILLLMGLTHVLEHAGLLHHFEFYALDTLFRTRVAPQSDRVVLVVIGEDDYRKSFDATSPLDGETLLKGLEVIARAEPCVIGVDLDTAESTFPYPPRFGVPVVWARGAELVHHKQHASHHPTGPPEVIVDPWLGSSSTTTAKPEWGAALAPLDPDGVVRRYWRVVRVIEERGADDKVHKLPKPDDHESLPWAIVRQYCSKRQPKDTENDPGCARLGDHQERAKAGEPAILNFSVDDNRFQKIPFSALLENETALAQSWKERLENRVVLVGGTYKAARDEHATPVGLRGGVELIADIVDMECDRQMIDETKRYQAVAFDLAIGVILLLVAWKLHGHAGALWIIAGTAILVVICTLIGSWLIFHTLAFWFSVTAPLTGVLLHLVWEVGSDYRQAHWDLAAARAEIQRLQTLLAESTRK